MNNVSRLKQFIFKTYQLLFDFHSSRPITVPVGMSKEEKEFFCSVISKSNRYLEFGSGGSTFLAIRHSNAHITSVDSDNNWFDYMRKWSVVKKAVSKGRLDLLYVDIGKTGMWGNPEDDLKKNELA